MLSLVFQKSIFFPIVLISLALLLVACDREEEDPLSPEEIAQLNGRWRITSYKIGGHEQIGNLVEAGALAFSPEGDFDGEFIQVVKFVDEPGETVIRGHYVVNAAQRTIRLEYDDEVVVAGIDIDGEDLIWSGWQEGAMLDMVATKRL